MSKALEAFLAQKKNNTKGSGSGANSFNLKNYFTTYLPEGTSALKKRIRILGDENSSPFIEVQAHKAQVDGQYRTLVCAKHEDDKPCPFCEAREALLATGKNSDKELAKKYGSRLVYVVKVIDRDDEEFGPKFWRFNHDYRNTGTLDKIGDIIGSLDGDEREIWNNLTGRDLIININRDSNQRPQISSILPASPSPLSDSPDQVTAWTGDERTWRDVYAIKPYDYSKLIVQGKVPTWDKENEKFVDKNATETETTDEDPASELRMGNQSTETETPTAKVEVPVTETPTNAPQAATTTEDDDLPF